MEILPFDSIGPYQFGSSRDSIQEMAKGKVRKGDVVVAGFEEKSDYLIEEEVKVYYDANNRTEAFEFFNASLSYRGQELGRMNAAELAKYFLNQNKSSVVAEDNVEVPDLGIKAIFPDKAMKLVRHFLVYQKGFFEQAVPSPDELIEALLGKGGA